MQGFVTSFWKEEARVRKFYFEKKKELEIVCSGMQMSVLKFHKENNPLCPQIKVSEGFAVFVTLRQGTKILFVSLFCSKATGLSDSRKASLSS